VELVVVEMLSIVAEVAVLVDIEQVQHQYQAAHLTLLLLVQVVLEFQTP
jgi:hypothetical protein